MYKKHRQFKTNLPMFMAMILLCLTLITTHLTGGLYAKYSTNAQSDDSGRVALFSVTENYTSFSTTLELPLEPGNYTKDIIVENNSEVAISYTITLENETDNIPLKLAVDNKEAVLDSCSSTHNMTQGATETRTIKVVWPAEGANDYIGRVDLIKITIVAEQID